MPYGVFKSSLISFLQEIKENESLSRALYVALECASGEVGIYTLLGGHLRGLLDKSIPDARLAINCCWPGLGLRPDFRIQLTSRPKQPIFAAEFKLVYEGGTANSMPEKVISRAMDDIDRLKTISNLRPGIGTAMVLFLHTQSAQLPDRIKDAMGDLQFEHLGPITMWNPSGGKRSPYFHIIFINHEEVLRKGNTEELDVVGG